MYRVFLSNHEYYTGDYFDTLDEALTWAKNHSFEVSIWLFAPDHDEKLVAAWSPINGTTRYQAGEDNGRN